MKFAYIALTMIFFNCKAFAETPNCHVTFHLKDCGKKEILVIETIDEEEKKLGTVQIVNGVGKIDLTLKESLLVKIKYQSKGDNAWIFLDQGNISIIGSLKNPWKMKVSGSPSHDFLLFFKDSVIELSQKYKNIESTTEKDSITGKITSYFIDFIRNKGASLAAYYFLYNIDYIYENNINKLEEITNLMSKVDTMKCTWGSKLENFISKNKLAQIGSEIDDFIFKDSAGKDVKITSFKGYYTLIDCWASWCGPCNREIPYLREALLTYEQNGFRILGISLDSDKQDWLDFISNEKMPWLQVIDDKNNENNFATKYNIESIPFNLLIDPNGKIIAKNLRGIELFKALRELIKSKR